MMDKMGDDIRAFKNQIMWIRHLLKLRGRTFTHRNATYVAYSRSKMPVTYLYRLNTDGHPYMVWDLVGNIDLPSPIFKLYEP